MPNLDVEDISARLWRHRVDLQVREDGYVVNLECAGPRYPDTVVRASFEDFGWEPRVVTLWLCRVSETQVDCESRGPIRVLELRGSRRDDAEKIAEAIVALFRRSEKHGRSGPGS